MRDACVRLASSLAVVACPFLEVLDRVLNLRHPPRPCVFGCSYSLEGLTSDGDGMKDCLRLRASAPDPGLAPRPKSEERGSVVSLTDEDLRSGLGERSNSLGRQVTTVAFIGYSPFAVI